MPQNYSYLESIENFENIDTTAQRVLITLVVDCSGSMEPHFPELQKKFDDFIAKSKDNEDVSRCADICIVTYGTEVTVPVRPMSIAKVSSVRFTNMGLTNTPKALETAIEESRKWRKTIQENGMQVWKPWVVLMTDGWTTYPDLDSGYSSCYSRTKMNEIIKNSREYESNGKHHIFALGMGTDYDSNELRNITDRCLAITDWNFDDFFGWLFKSVATMSQPTISFSGSGNAVDSDTGEEVTAVDTGEEFQAMLSKFLSVKS